MKTTRALFTALLISLSSRAHATQNAQATLFCYSLRFGQGVESWDDSRTLDLSTLPGTPNGELGAWFESSTHRSLFALNFSGSRIRGTLYLNVPEIPDANGNGIADFFEVAQAVASKKSYGEYATQLGGGLITATWNRAAGSRTGTCQLHLVEDTFEDLGTYQHTFEVLELTGSLAYTPGSNTVSGSLNLTNPTVQLRGPLSFIKSAANPSNELTLAAGGWTNATWQTLTYAIGTVQRDTPWSTNYYGIVEFDDGDPSTGGADYRMWYLSIDDPNDCDHNGIPDFSDTPASVASERPVLSLAGGATNLLLTVSGCVGRLHDIQAVTSVTATDWQTVASLTLTNDPQTIVLPLPATMTKFWRAVAH